MNLRESRGHGWLLAALLLMIVESSLRLFPGFERIAHTALFTGVILAGIHSSAGRGRLLRGAMAVGLPTVAFQWLSYSVDAPWVVYLSVGSGAVLLLYAGLAILQQIFRAESITVDLILGGVVVYLLVGVLFLLLFTLVETQRPGAFAGGWMLEKEGWLSAGLMYFSFVTLTTLGYGDIQPVSEMARTLAYLEAIIGQLYLTVLIAWLVGVHVSQSRARSD